MMSQSKLSVSLLTALFAFIAVGCGLSKQNPMEDYKDLVVVPEKNGLSNQKVEYVVIENNKNVLTQVDDKDPRATDGAGQVALQQGVYQVSAPENVSFIVDKAKSFEFSVKFLRGKTKFDIEREPVKLNINGTEVADSSMKIEMIDQNESLSKYKVSWMAPKELIPADKFTQNMAIKIALKDLQYISQDAKENEEAKKAYDSLLLKTSEVNLVVRKNTEMPKITVNGLDKKMKIGEVYKFSVDVTAPASYTSADPITPEVFYDLTRIVNSNGLVEANGAYFVSIDPEHTKVEKISTNKWRINYIFDTKNVTMLQQFDKTLRVVDSDKLAVSLSFRVTSDKLAVSEIKTVRFDISLK